MKNPPDRSLLTIIGALVIAGVFILTSASIGLLARNGANFYDVLLRQFAFGIAAGGILFWLTLKISYKKLQKIALPFFAFSFVLTLLVFIPGIGIKLGGANRWLDLRIFSFQPSELLKFAFIVYLAAWLSGNKNNVQTARFGLLPFLIMSGFVGILLILQPDVGTLGVTAISAAILFFLGGGKISHIAAIAFLGVAALSVLIIIQPYRMDRLTVFLKPSTDQTGIGWHLKQSLVAVGSGGVFGRGFGMGLQKFRYLPEPIGDSVFAVFSEEFGFAGSVTLVILFIFFARRGFNVANRAPDDFGRLLGSGIVILIVVQVFINIGAMVGLLPLTGVPLVFVSKGGTALAIALAEAGVLLNISRYNNA